MKIQIKSIEATKYIPYCRSILDTLPYKITHQEILDLLLAHSNDNISINDIIFQEYVVYKPSEFINITIIVEDNQNMFLIENNTFSYIYTSKNGLNFIEGVIE